MTKRVIENSWWFHFVNEKKSITRNRCYRDTAYKYKVQETNRKSELSSKHPNVKAVITYIYFCTAANWVSEKNLSKIRVSDTKAS